MKGTTHFLGGVVAYATLAKTGLLPGEPLYYIAPAFGALLPDIDHGGSFISRRLPVIGVIIPKMVNHRGPTHSLLATAAVGLLTFILSIVVWPYLPATMCIGVVVGYFSHILLDMLTVEGTEVWWPDKRNYHFWTLTTGGWGETAVTATMFAWLIVLYAGDIADLFYHTTAQMKPLLGSR